MPMPTRALLALFVLAQVAAGQNPPPDSAQKPPVQKPPAQKSAAQKSSGQKASAQKSATPAPAPDTVPPRRFPFWPDSVPGPAARAGAILPFKRIVAFYGNPLSTRMGILGQIPPA
ncbi:MAG TPA: hypothetical protein VE967_08705, partial [Gemmatimonadaceae bacterium]|nr:hypothetical protein [Gemmatimonadaceae bacterium]